MYGTVRVKQCRTVWRHTQLNCIVQHDVKRCQMSKEVDPVLMNGNRWVRRRAAVSAKNWRGCALKRDEDWERQIDRGGERVPLNACGFVLFRITLSCLQ